ncbi:MAG: spermidine synthase-like protein [Ramlibacter sp.]|nr:spermidine synthase-like protein [Ramlibacter sp.]
MPAEFANLGFDAPFVLEDGPLRSLHFTIGEVQSTMRTDRPDELQIDYTRTMMGFLLLSPQPRHIAMIGLGGGSLAKFCHRFLPSARITAVENNPGVIALREEFGIPGDDARLSVMAQDGAAFVGASRDPIDVLLVDGFDHTGQPAQLCSQAFYDACFRALAPDGVLVVNLHADDADHLVFTGRIAASFGGNAMQVLADEKSNCIVFAARGRSVTLQALRNLEWSAALHPQAQRQLRGEFARIGWNAGALAVAG